jgi:hypothetical protein
LSSGLDQLDPLAPLQTQETLEQRLTRKLAGFEARLAALERTRAATGVGDGPPSGETLPGTRYMDETNRAFWVHGGADQGWISASAPRAEVVQATQVSTSSTSFVDLGGPRLAMFVPEPGIIAIQVDVELFSVSSSTSYTDAQVALVQPNGKRQLTLSLGASGRVTSAPELIYDHWWRLLSTAARDTLALGGTPYPNGGFMLVPVEAGEQTWSLEYRASAFAGSVSPVSFRSRRLWGVAL